MKALVKSPHSEWEGLILEVVEKSKSKYLPPRYKLRTPEGKYIYIKAEYLEFDPESEIEVEPPMLEFIVNRRAKVFSIIEMENDIVKYWGLTYDEAMDELKRLGERKYLTYAIVAEIVRMEHTPNLKFSDGVELHLT